MTNNEIISAQAAVFIELETNLGSVEVLEHVDQLFTDSNLLWSYSYIAREGQPEEKTRLLSSVMRFRSRVVWEKADHELRVRQAERVVVAAGVGVILLGVSFIFSISQPFVAILPILAGGYAAIRGVRRAQQSAKVVARCSSILASLEGLVAELRTNS